MRLSTIVNKLARSPYALGQRAPHALALRVRLNETDALGVVYYANYFVYFDLARTELLRGLGLGPQQLELSGLRFLAAEARCRYLAPVGPDEELVVETWLKRIGRTSITYRHRVKRSGGKRVAEGEVRDVLADKAGRPVPLPQAWVEKLKPYLRGEDGDGEAGR
ncbi:MAG: hypothetical protein C4339_06305 [Nitrososphaerota archaeon]